MNRLTNYIDWTFCLIMVPLMTLVFPVGRWVSDRPSYTALLIAILYLDYFINRKFGLPLCFSHRHGKAVCLLIFVAFVCCIAALTYYHEGWPFYRLAQIYPHVDLAKVEMSQQRIWLAFLIVHLFSVTVGLGNELNRQRIRQQAIQDERNRAALAFYRAQLSPHFLYNTLNSLYGLIVTHSDLAEQAFMQFIELTRFVTASVQKDSVLVEEVQQYLHNFIDLQRLRVDGRTTVMFHYESDDSSARIAPMLLITFVENALKYGAAHDRPSRVCIQLKVRNGVLTFTTENPFMPSTKESGSGTGLANCRRRLNLLYPGRHHLDITRTGDYFRVFLTIQLTASP